MTLDEASKINLIKWPELLVKGTKVTMDQASEINIRTGLGDGISCNDQVWERELKQAVLDECELDVELERYGLEGWGEVKEKLGLLDLGYLHNDNIASSYIGGPMGWCSWTGLVQGFGKNIGKWPSVESVYGDWCTIAKAFPYLHLRSQLINCEAGDEHKLAEHEIEYDEESSPKFPVVEFHIYKGTVEIEKPKARLINVEVDAPAQFIATLIAKLKNPFGERGCSIEQFRHGLKCALERKK